MTGWTQPFSVARLPRIEFGAGVLAKAPTLLRRYGQRILIVTGSRSFRESDHWTALQNGLKEAGISWETVTVRGEPSPQFVDQAVTELRGQNMEAVLGIGGGSVLDAAKAIAGLLKPGNSVMDHLEGVGPELPYAGPATPFIAVPTTAGTGSEATKNAVLSVPGQDGFKKSFRDEQLVPEYALVDPRLLASCTADLIAANGMDALTQLLESYVSLKANPFTDALSRSGLEAVRDGLLEWHDGGEAAVAAQERMAYGALLSGITLAQVGLGSVHGLASPLGAFFPIPHGVVCGTLVAAATDANIRALQERAPDNPALAKYAQAGRLLAGDASFDDQAARDALLDTLALWTNRLALPRLGRYGITDGDVPHIVAHCRGSSMKTNPIVCTDEEIAAIIRQRI